METNQLLNQIYAHLEANDVEKAVMTCLRLSRGTKDYLNAAVFLTELSPKKQEFVRALYNETSHLKEEAQTFLYETAWNRWLEIHTLDFSLSPDKPDHNVLLITVSELDPEITQLERTVAEMVVPAYMHPYDAAAFTDQFDNKKALFRLRIKAVQTIRARLKARCVNYANQVELQLELQRKNQGFLDVVQNDVNNFFKARSNDVYIKLQKAAELAASPELENAALLLTEVRRALKAAADFFYPPVQSSVLCSDGKERELGDDKYLNPLHEFLAAHIKASTSKDLLRAELEAFGRFLQRLNDLASKGVHASVALTEAKQGLVGLYFFLFNLPQNLLSKEAS